MNTITRSEYEAKREHDYAGPGTPCHPDAPGHWVMGMDADGATVLWTGVSLEDTRILGSDAVRAIGRFNPAGTEGYRATYPNAPLRATRDEAMEDARFDAARKDAKTEQAEVQA